MDIIPPDSPPSASDCLNPTIPSFHTNQLSVRPALSFRHSSRWCKRKEKAFFQQRRQRAHPGQHHKCSDRHHKWLNSQWLHLEGKGGEGQGRGCLTGPFARKGHLRLERAECEGRGANHILQGLHRLCEVLARLSLYTESDDGTGAADIQISIRSNEDFSSGTMMSPVKVHRLNLHVFKVEIIAKGRFLLFFFFTAVETTANLENVSSVACTTFVAITTRKPFRIKEYSYLVSINMYCFSTTNFSLYMLKYAS